MTSGLRPGNGDALRSGRWSKQLPCRRGARIRAGFDGRYLNELGVLEGRRHEKILRVVLLLQRSGEDLLGSRLEGAHRVLLQTGRHVWRKLRSSGRANGDTTDGHPV